MIYLYLVYGLSFIVLGVSMVLLSASDIRVLPARAGFLLAAFALLHGAFELVRMFQIIEAEGFANASPPIVDAVSVFLLPLSYLCLLAFGIETLIGCGKLPKSTRPLSFGFMAFGIVLVFGYLTWAQWGQTWADRIETYTRFGVALPASVLAAYSLWTFAGQFKNSHKFRIENVLKLAAVAFFFYGIASSVLNLVGARDLFFPEHMRLVSPAVVILRSGFAILICTLLADAFFIETADVRKSLERRRQEFSSMISHDLRNIAGQIQNSSDILIEDLQHRKELVAQVDLLRILYNSSKTLNSLISDMFDISLLDLNKVKLHKHEGELCNFISEICRRHASLFAERTLKVHCPADTVSALIDWHRFDQILSNLLSNAAKYSLPGSEVVVDLAVKGSMAVLSVTNMTVPLTDTEKGRLFSRYFRAKSSSQTVKGTGLGLVIVKGLVEAHGGNVSVETTPEGRFKFTVVLPMGKETGWNLKPIQSIRADSTTPY